MVHDPRPQPMCRTGSESSAAPSGLEAGKHEFEEIRFFAAGEISLLDVLMDEYRSTPDALDTSDADRGRMQVRSVRPFNAVILRLR